MLKKDLIKQNEELKLQIFNLESRPAGHTVQNCTIDMDSSKENIAIAEAVKEGMKALQDIASQNKYGIYFNGNS